MSTTRVRVRIAPSPTGDPHVGTAYVALYNYVFAKKHGGEFVLRIEDTDRARSTPESEAAILESLRWLGLTWDEGPDVGGPFAPYRQSERSQLYQDHARILMDRGLAYRCFCTPERLTEMRAAQRSTGAIGYDRLCRSLPQEESDRRAAAGEPFVVRLAFPLGGDTSWSEPMRGTLTFENRQVDDQILLKSDGFPTYHLANVVDDHLMQISHVVRAEEWISSTPKHVFLYEAFGWEAPQFIHLPLLRNADRSKISKRKNPVSLEYYRSAGFLADAMLNFLAMMGWTMPDGREVFSLPEMIDEFSFERISLGGPVFDLSKLTWLNGQYIRSLDEGQLLDLIRTEVLGPDYLRRIIPLLQKRMERLSEFIPKTTYFFTDVLDYDPDLLVFKVARFFAKKGRKPAVEDAELVNELKAVYQQLDKVAEHMDTIYDFVESNLEEKIRTFSEEQGSNTGQLFMCIRVALTGSPATPPLFETMEVLGRARVQSRLRDALSKIALRLQGFGQKPPSVKKRKGK